jgi:hypothetical protein
MEKKDFEADTRCTVAWKQPDGHVIPATIYVHRTYDSYMVVRMTGSDAMLRKIDYKDITRIVSTEPVTAENRRTVPAAMLDEKTWRDRNEMEHYASSSARGK